MMVSNSLLTAKLSSRFGRSLPDVSVACGSPAWANVEKKEWEPARWWLLPSPFDITRLWFGTTYIFQFPFCSNCEPENFHLKPARLDRRLAVFIGARKRLLDVLPPVSEHGLGVKALSHQTSEFSRPFISSAKASRILQCASALASWQENGRTKKKCCPPIFWWAASRLFRVPVLLHLTLNPFNLDRQLESKVRSSSIRVDTA
jgi:hypothetical protein